MTCATSSTRCTGRCASLPLHGLCRIGESSTLSSTISPTWDAVFHSLPPAAPRTSPIAPQLGLGCLALVKMIMQQFYHRLWYCNRRISIHTLSMRRWAAWLVLCFNHRAAAATRSCCPAIRTGCRCGLECRGAASANHRCVTASLLTADSCLCGAAVDDDGDPAASDDDDADDSSDGEHAPGDADLAERLLAHAKRQISTLSSVLMKPISSSLHRDLSCSEGTCTHSLIALLQHKSVLSSFALQGFCRSQAPLKKEWSAHLS